MLMVALAMKLRERYPELRLPVVIIAGEGDRMIDFDRQPKRLNKEIPQSELVLVSGGGHMAHHIAPEQVIGGVDRIATPTKTKMAQGRDDFAAPPRPRSTPRP